MSGFEHQGGRGGGRWQPGQNNYNRGGNYNQNRNQNRGRGGGRGGGAKKPASMVERSGPTVPAPVMLAQQILTGLGDFSVMHEDDGSIR